MSKIKIKCVMLPSLQDTLQRTSQFTAEHSITRRARYGEIRWFYLNFYFKNTRRHCLFPGLERRGWNATAESQRFKPGRSQLSLLCKHKSLAEELKPFFSVRNLAWVAFWITSWKTRSVKKFSRKETEKRNSHLLDVMRRLLLPFFRVLLLGVVVGMRLHVRRNIRGRRDAASRYVSVDDSSEKRIHFLKGVGRLTIYHQHLWRRPFLPSESSFSRNRRWTV